MLRWTPWCKLARLEFTTAETDLVVGARPGTTARPRRKLCFVPPRLLAAPNYLQRRCSNASSRYPEAFNSMAHRTFKLLQSLALEQE